jgi:hypothetical protein
MLGLILISGQKIKLVIIFVSYIFCFFFVFSFLGFFCIFFLFGFHIYQSIFFVFIGQNFLNQFHLLLFLLTIFYA